MVFIHSNFTLFAFVVNPTIHRTERTFYEGKVSKIKMLKRRYKKKLLKEKTVKLQKRFSFSMVVKCQISLFVLLFAMQFVAFLVVPLDLPLIVILAVFPPVSTP